MLNFLQVAIMVTTITNNGDYAKQIQVETVPADGCLIAKLQYDIARDGVVEGLDLARNIRVDCFVSGD